MDEELEKQDIFIWHKAELTFVDIKSHAEQISSTRLFGWLFEGKGDSFSSTVTTALWNGTMEIVPKISVDYRFHVDVTRAAFVGEKWKANIKWIPVQPRCRGRLEEQISWETWCTSEDL